MTTRQQHNHSGRLPVDHPGAVSNRRPSPRFEEGRRRGPVSAGSAREPFGPAALGLPEDGRNLVNHVQQLLAIGRVHRLLGGTGLLDRQPELLVEVGVGLKVFGLEVVSPQHRPVSYTHLTLPTIYSV